VSYEIYVSYVSYEIYVSYVFYVFYETYVFYVFHQPKLDFLKIIQQNTIKKIQIAYFCGQIFHF
jgi:hypothetical protein